MRRLVRLLWRILTFPFRLLFWLIRTLFGWITGLFAEFRVLFSEEPEDSDLSDAFVSAVENPGSLLIHLLVLRKHLIRSAVVFLITTAISFAFAGPILSFLARPIGGIEQLEAIGVTEPVGVFMRVSLLSGFAVALPYMVMEMLLFAAPGLKKSERWIGMLIVPVVTLLFFGGAGFAYFVILEPALRVLTTGFFFQTTPQPSSYYPFVTQLMFWFGISFQFPLILYIIVRLGFVQARVLLEQSRVAMVVIAVLAAMITPTVDPINMLLVWGPLVGLYFLGVGLAFIAQRGRDRRLKSAA